MRNINWLFPERLLSAKHCLNVHVFTPQPYEICAFTVSVLHMETSKHTESNLPKGTPIGTVEPWFASEVSTTLPARAARHNFPRTAIERQEWLEMLAPALTGVTWIEYIALLAIKQEGG